MSGTPHDIQELLPAYALGSLEGEERDRLEAHLPGCARCREMLQEYQQVAEGMLFAAPPAEPPARLRRRLTQSLGGTSSRRTPRLAALRPSLAWVGAGAALAALVVLNLVQLSRTQSLLGQLESAADQQRAGQVALALNSYATSQTVSVEGDGVRGTFVYDPEFAVAVMYLWGLDDPGPAGDYQAWLISADGSRASGGLLQLPEEPGFAWLVVRAPRPMSEFVGFGVTLEPSGGSPGPTGPRIVGADL